MFKHGIRGDRPRIPDGMPESIDPLPPKFFGNLRCPPPPLAPTLIEAKPAEAHLVEKTKDPVEGAVVGEQC